MDGEAGCYQEMCLEAYSCFSFQEKGPKDDPTSSPVRVSKAACQRDKLTEQVSSTLTQTTTSGPLNQLAKSGTLSSYHTALLGIPTGQNLVLPFPLMLPGRWGRRKRKRTKKKQ